MAENTRVSEEEMIRRESYLRAGQRERHILDPYTWTYPWKNAGVMVGGSLVAMYVSNIWNKKPWYFAAYPRAAVFAVMFAVGYGSGLLRERHYQTRDAVVDHYVQLHPDDFDMFKDRAGRPFSQIMLPWYPRRAQYTKHE